MVQINVHEVEARMNVRLRAGYCSHPDPASDPCGGRVIKAHTVQRKGGLASIAEKGHVLSVKPTMKSLIEDMGESWPRPIGVGKASVFPGFCEKHDTSIFKAVEGASLALNADHAFLLAYRAIAYERFSKEGQRRGTEIQRDMDRDYEFWKQAAVQQLLHDTMFGIQMGLADIERTKSEFDIRLLNNDRQGFHHLAVRFDRVLPIVACTAFHPEFDFAGKQLQRLGHGDADFDMVTLTVTAYEGHTVAIFGWVGDVDGPAGRLAGSFNELPEETRADALLRLLFVQTDNLFLRPSWWESIDRVDQVRLVGQVMAGTTLKARQAADLVAEGQTLVTASLLEVSTG